MNGHEKKYYLALFNKAATALSATGLEGICWSDKEIKKVATSLPEGLKLIVALAEKHIVTGGAQGRERARDILFLLDDSETKHNWKPLFVQEMQAKKARFALDLMDDEVVGPHFFRLGKIACEGGSVETKKEAEEKIISSLLPTKGGQESRIKGLYGIEAFKDFWEAIIGYLAEEMDGFHNDERRAEPFLWAIQSTQHDHIKRRVLNYWIETLDVSAARNPVTLKKEVVLLEEALKEIMALDDAATFQKNFTKRMLPQEGTLSRDHLYNVTGQDSVKGAIVEHVFEQKDSFLDSDSRDQLVKWVRTRTTNAGIISWCDGYFAKEKFRQRDIENKNFVAVRDKARELHRLLSGVKKAPKKIV